MKGRGARRGAGRDLLGARRVRRGGRERTGTWRLAATTLFVVVGGLLAALAPLAIKGMIDAVTGAQDSPRTAIVSATTFGAVYLAALCGGRLLTELRLPLMGLAEQRLYARLRRRFFGNLLQLGLAFHLTRRTAALVHSLQRAHTCVTTIVYRFLGNPLPVLTEVLTWTRLLLPPDTPQTPPHCSPWQTGCPPARPPAGE